MEKKKPAPDGAGTKVRESYAKKKAQTMTRHSP